MINPPYDTQAHPLAKVTWTIVTCVYKVSLTIDTCIYDELPGFTALVLSRRRGSRSMWTTIVDSSLRISLSCWRTLQSAEI